MTIVEAIKQVMRDTGRPMTVAEVCDAIIAQGLYGFNADQPVQIGIKSGGIARESTFVRPARASTS